MENSFKKKPKDPKVDVQSESWKSLNTAAIAIVFLNSTFYFLISKHPPQTLLLNFVFLGSVVACHSLYLRMRLYRYESSKLKLATQRRKAVLIGISFRENFQFPTTASTLGGTETLKRFVLVVAAFALTFFIRDYIGLSLVSWAIGLLILFALSPTWLWIPVLFSMFFLAVGTHESYGARHVVSFLILTLIGIQCLIFSWHVGNRLEAIKLQLLRTPTKQNGSQIALLALAFVGIATIVFICLPKQLDVGKFQLSKSSYQRMEERANTDALEASNSNFRLNKPGFNTGAGSSSGPSRGISNSNAKNDTSGSNGSQTEAPGSNGYGGSGSGSAGSSGKSGAGGTSNNGSSQSGGSGTNGSGGAGSGGTGPGGTGPGGTGSGSTGSGGTGSGVSEGGPVSSEAKTKSNSGEKANTAPETMPATKLTAASKKFANHDSKKGGSDSKTSSSSRNNGSGKSKIRKELSPEKRDENKPENKRLLHSIIIVATVLLIALIAFLFVKKKKEKMRPESTTSKDLPSKAEIAEAMQRFKTEYKAIIASAKAHEDIKVLVVSLYNLLLTHYEGCGLAKPNYATPDEFHRNEYIYRTWSKNALAHVTETFNRVFYGNKLPAAKDFATYCDNIAQLGQMLAKIAPHKTN